jgi:DNA-binding response OmpR family regulator
MNHSDTQRPPNTSRSDLLVPYGKNALPPRKARPIITRQAELPNRLLIVEDEEAMRRLLTLSLKQQGYEVKTARDGREAIQFFTTEKFDLILLDIHMPVMDGFDTCTELRKQTHVPILFITASSRSDDLHKGIELGGDNYLIKPFTMPELSARIVSLLRRTYTPVLPPADNVVRIGELSINFDRHEVTVHGELVNLTPIEYRFLSYLAQNPARVIEKAELIAAVWDYDSVDENDFVRVMVRRLRQKIEPEPSRPRYLKTVHGVGYQFGA